MVEWAGCVVWCSRRETWEDDVAAGREKEAIRSTRTRSRKAKHNTQGKTLFQGYPWKMLFTVFTMEPVG